MVTKSKNSRNIWPLVATLGIIVIVLIFAVLLKEADVALLNAKGMVADEQQWLLIASTLTMLGFAVPVILTIYYFAWKYREGNERTAYAPETKNSKAFLLFAWGGPLATVIILASMMLPATQRLEPQAAIKSDKEQLTVQVVAMNWKWLFIYPEQHIATVNFVQIPVDTPVRFELTADEAPMSAFWVPHLGGMLYAMTGHINPLNLIADTVGDYPGSSAEINGKGFSGMKFTARVSTQKDFDAWVAITKQSPVSLSDAEYKKLLVPSDNVKPLYYSSPNPDMFNSIVSKYKDGHQHGSETKAYRKY